MARSKHKGGKNGKAVKQATRKSNGYYARQALRTILNRKRKQLKHLKAVEKKASKRRPFILS